MMKTEQAIEDITNYLENMDVEPEQLPFWKRLKIYWDFQSQIKHIWLTGYLLLTWEWDGYLDTLWRTLDYGWYEGGSYE